VIVRERRVLPEEPVVLLRLQPDLVEHPDDLGMATTIISSIKVKPV